ncbi:MAG: phosphatase PAP2 family protein [Chloroflexi bacterium]|nr:phosphatase PAP2 family protein [Chloroflexota bacterium]
MQTLIDGGIAFIIGLQGLGDWLTLPMRFFSYLGTEDFFFLVLPLIYWSIDSALGLRVGFILVTSSMFNYLGKALFAGPRPYWVSSHVRALWPETSFGVPSGHAQNAMSVWGIIAAYRKQVWVWVAAIALIFFIGFSRLFLGSHFPHDVIAGWLLGGALLWAFSRFWEPLAQWIGKKSLTQQTIYAFVGSMSFVVLGMAVLSLRSGFQIPALWMDNALLAGTDLPAPVDPNGIYTSAGTFFGLGFGLAWIMSMGGYQANGPVWMRALRYVIGLVGILILWMGLGEIFPRGDGALVYSLRFIRYALVGWWVTGGAPWVFIRFKLVEVGRGKTSI